MPCLDLFSASLGLRTCPSLMCNAAFNSKSKYENKAFTLSKTPRTWTFHFVVLQRTAKKLTKNHKYNARAQLLFCLLNLLFFGVLVAVAVMVCEMSLLSLKDGNQG